MANYSYQNIVEIILKIAENHGSFKSVESGDIFEREKSLKNSYPLFFLHYQDNRSEENYLVYNFELYATDTVLAGKSNELQVLSNCQKWLNDIVNYLRRLDLPLIELEFGNNSSPITKGLISGGAGWVYSLSLKTPYDINSCDTPIDTIELPPIQERQIIYENVLGYQGPQGFSGNTGFQGAIGNTGNDGSSGTQGNQGFQGLVGDTGLVGGFTIVYDTAYSEEFFTSGKIAISDVDFTYGDLYISFTDKNSHDFTAFYTSLKSSIDISSPSQNQNIFLKIFSTTDSSQVGLYSLPVSGFQVYSEGIYIYHTSLTFLGGNITNPSEVGISFLLNAGDVGSNGNDGAVGSVGGFSIEYPVDYESSGFRNQYLEYSKGFSDGGFSSTGTLYLSRYDINNNDFYSFYESLYESILSSSPSRGGYVYIKLFVDNTKASIFRCQIGNITLSGDGLQFDNFTYVGGNLNYESVVFISFLLNAGDAGLQGEAGVNGYQGPQGNQGWQGFQGISGNVGNTGTQGNSGSNGNQGPQGNQGFQGVLGETGGYGLTYSGTSSQIPYFNSNTGLTSSQNFRTDGGTWLIFGTGSSGMLFRPNTSSSTLGGIYPTGQAPSNTNHAMIINGGTFLNATSASNLQLQNGGSTILTINPTTIVAAKLMTITDTVAGTTLDITNSTTSAAANGLKVNMANSGFNATQGILVLNSTTATTGTVQNYINIQKNNINATVNQEHNISYSLRDNSTSREAGKLSFAYTDTSLGTQRTRFSFFVFAGTASAVESVRIDGYNTSVGGLTASTARLHIAAGGTASGTGALKLTAGATVSVVEDGLFEYDGTNLFFTIGGVRKTFTLT